MKTMAHKLFNHIQGKKGSRWAEFVKETGAGHILLVAVDAAKYTHKALIGTFFGDILVQPFEFDASTTGFNKLRKIVESTKQQYDFKEIVFGVQTTGHYYESL